MKPSIIGTLPMRMSAVRAAATRKSRPSLRYSRSSSAGAPASSRATSYPALLMASTNFSGLVAPGLYSTVAVSAAKLTRASKTPSPSERARSTRRTQDAHVNPVTGIVTVLRPRVSITDPFLRSYTIPPYPM
jgi:hypothetical protein